MKKRYCKVYYRKGHKKSKNNDCQKRGCRCNIAPIGGGVSGESVDRSARCFHNPVYTSPERPPLFGTWQSARSYGSSALDGAQQSILILIVERMSASLKMPKFLKDVIGATGTPPIDNTLVGCWWRRRPVVHHMTSTLSEFNCSLKTHPVRDDADALKELRRECQRSSELKQRRRRRNWRR